MSISSNTQLITKWLALKHPLILVLSNQEKNKSEFLTEFVKIARTSQRVIRIQGSVIIQSSQLIHLLCKNWELPIPPESLNLKNRLEEILMTMKKKHFYGILVIDDADLLSLSSLTALSYLFTSQENQETHFQLILSGQPSFYDKIKHYGSQNPPYINLDANDTVLTPKGSRFFQKHVIKSFSIVALIIFTFFIHWFDQKGHEYFKLPGFDTHHIHETKTTIRNPVKNNIFKPGQAQTILSSKLNKQIENISKTQKFINKSSEIKQGYIIQLMSNHHINVLNAFIKSHHLSNRVQILKNYFHDQYWNVLAYGEYPTYNDAKKALSQLPPVLKSLHPWIRPRRTLKLI